MSFIDGMCHATGLRALASSEVLGLERADFERLIATDLVCPEMRTAMRAAHDLLHWMNVQYGERSSHIFPQRGRSRASAARSPGGQTDVQV